MFSEKPPGSIRRWNALPFPDEINAKAWRESFASDSRIITPALAQVLEPWSDATRAEISTSPVIG